MAHGNVIQIPIRDKTPAKVYFVAYPERIRKYAIAEILYGRDEPKRKKRDKRGNLVNVGEGRVRNPNLVITAISNNQELFEDVKEGVLSQARPLRKELLKELKQKLPSEEKQPTAEEKKQLLNFLDKEFRGIVKNYIHLIEDYNPYIILRDILGRMASLYVAFREEGVNEGSVLNAEVKVMENLPYTLVKKLQYLVPKGYREEDKLIAITMGASFFKLSQRREVIAEESRQLIDVRKMFDSYIKFICDILAMQKNNYILLEQSMDFEVVDLMVKKYEKVLRKQITKGEVKEADFENYLEEYRKGLQKIADGSASSTYGKILDEMGGSLKEIKRQDSKLKELADNQN